MIKILFMGNNRVAFEIAKFLKQRGESIALAVVHPENKSRYRNETLEVLDLPAASVLDASTLKTPQTMARILESGVNLGLSIYFGYIVPQSLLSAMEMGVINLHPSYLPYNRGAYPNVWSIVDKTPAGASLHYLDEGIDTGDIIVQTKVSIIGSDTGKSLYHKLEQASIELFCSHWDRIKKGDVMRRPQNKNEGTFHRTIDVKNIDQIDLDREYKARDLIDILRARTFDDCPGAYIMDQGKKIYLKLDLREDNPQSC